MRLLRIGNRLARLGSRLVRGLCPQCCAATCIEYYAAQACETVGLCTDAVYVCREQLDKIGGPGTVFSFSFPGNPATGGVCYVVPGGSSPVTGESIPDEAPRFDGPLTPRSGCADPLCDPLNDDRLVEGTPCDPTTPDLRAANNLPRRVFVPVSYFTETDPPRPCLLFRDQLNRCWKFVCAPPYFSAADVATVPGDVLLFPGESGLYDTCCECGCLLPPGGGEEITQCGNVIGVLECCCPPDITGATATFYSKRVSEFGQYTNFGDGNGCTCVQHVRVTVERFNTLQRTTTTNVCTGAIESVVEVPVEPPTPQCPVSRRTLPCPAFGETVEGEITCTSYYFIIRQTTPCPDFGVCETVPGINVQFDCPSLYYEERYSTSGVNFAGCTGGCGGSNAGAVRVAGDVVKRDAEKVGCGGCKNAPGLEGVRA